MLCRGWNVGKFVPTELPTCLWINTKTHIWMHHNQFNNTPSLTGDGSWFHYFNSVMAEHVMASHDTSPHPKRGPEWYLQLEKLQDMSF
jgi:hypothetical protein